METNQKYALITGATSGIGFELAKLFAHNNYNLVLVARSQEDLDMTAIELEILFGADVIKIAKDLFKIEDAFALCEEIRANGISIDVLVNDTGYCVYSEFDGAGIERELDIINLNICATVILTKHFVKEMLIRGKGKILNLGSAAGNLPDAWQAVSRASEAFVLSYTTLVRKELKNTGITLTTLTPDVKNASFFNKTGTTESKTVGNKETVVNLANVAWDGFKALMAGNEQVISAYL